MDCTVSTVALDGVTLVSAIVENPHEEAARYRLENELDGPIWPPRRRGIPERGWDESGYESVLGVGERESIGYAVPAPPADPVARIAWTEPADSLDGLGDRNSATGREATSIPSIDPAGDVAGSALRSFGDPRPPRSVLTPPGFGFATDRSTGEWP